MILPPVAGRACSAQLARKARVGRARGRRRGAWWTYGGDCMPSFWGFGSCYVRGRCACRGCFVLQPPSPRQARRSKCRYVVGAKRVLGVFLRGWFRWKILLGRVDMAARAAISTHRGFALRDAVVLLAVPGVNRFFRCLGTILPEWSRPGCRCARKGSTPHQARHGFWIKGDAAGVRFQCVVANQPRNRLYAESGALQLMQPGKTYAAVFGFVFDGPAVCSQGCCWAVMRASCEHTETAVAHILYSSSQPGLPLMWWRGKHSKASIDLAMERSSDFAVQQASAYRNGVHNDRIAARFWRADYVMRLCKKEEHPWHCNESAFSSWQNLPFA